MLKWMKTPEAQRIATAAKEKAWNELLKTFPRADRSKFVIQADFIKNHKAVAEVFLKTSDGLKSVFGSDSRFWSQQMKTALGIGAVNNGFPYQLSPLKTRNPLPIPAVDFTETTSSIKEMFAGLIKIYATPNSFFQVKLRDIFLQTNIKHYTAAESRAWLSGPSIKYWPQQLNFAVFCATQGCGISREVLELNMPDQIKAFYKFHVYFTVRRILFQMGGIQSMSALPGDPSFNPLNNKYDVAAYKRICGEFGISPSSDFRFTGGKNNGLGNVFSYPGPEDGGFSYPSWMKFSDEGGKAIDGNLIAFIQPNDIEQYAWFVPKNSSGLTKAGLARINQSIEAFVYCILGAQVNVRSSIIGGGGRATEAQTEFLTLMESAIIQPDLAQSVQRYQLAVDEAKVRLNLAVAPMAWLMPANMIINTASVVGYNNKLKQAVSGTKLGLNNELNTETKKSALQLMAGGPSKVNPPNSHPSNPIHKAVMAAQNPKKKVRFNLPNEVGQGTKKNEVVQDDSHETNKTAVIVGAVAVGALAMFATR